MPTEKKKNPLQMTMDKLAPRRAALKAFDAVYRRRRPLDAALEGVLNDADMQQCDKMFVRLLTTEMLRHAGEADVFWQRFVKHPLPAKETFVRDVLGLAAVQTLYLKTPPHAVVSTGAELLKPYKNGAFVAFANAVLRKAATAGPLPKEAYMRNFPDWLIKIWRKTYGFEKTKQIARAFLKEAPLDFSVKDNPNLWAEKLEGKVLFGNTVRRSETANVTDLEGFRSGNWWVQDFSASLPVRMFSSLKGKKVLDVCAAPGGKTAQLCAAGADVTALDVSERRLGRLKENMARLGYAPRVVGADFLNWQSENRFDCILLDAPCSATGTLRRHPDVMHHRSAADIERLNGLQKELLEKALSLLAVDGELVYAVCSLLPQEGVELINYFENEGKIRRMPLTAAHFPEKTLNAQGDVLVFPDTFEAEGGCDGFYACRLKKVEKHETEN